jgi:hypothetical protein
MEAREPLIEERLAQLRITGQQLSEEITLTKALGGGFGLIQKVY